MRAAHSRFIRLGYERTTLRDVAADAGVNIALVKRYFGSKEGLFKAALAANPRFLDSAESYPAGATELADVLARQLSVDAWPEFGEHPVLMLLRAPSEGELGNMRRAALEDYAHRILDSAGGSLPEADDRERALRSQLVVALGVGVAALRSSVALQPLGDAEPDDLAPLLRLVLTALLRTPEGGGAPEARSTGEEIPANGR
ncbi:TetR family transcriptional regulator [Streptomyces sp. NPDC050264]|uniref:TetR/AcrR family transcriptional regulator n=1 Tax=Streptomyces sp. NPDC050264 TaxID=3155038 RepID=UPI0034408D82